MGCLSGCLMSSTSVQRLFRGSCSAFKWSFDEFVGEKVVSPSYSSTILGPPSRIDWFNLLAVQGTLKSLLQHHSLKVSILRHSAFFTVQLSQPHMTTGKTIAMTRWTFVGNVMSLLSSFIFCPHLLSDIGLPLWVSCVFGQCSEAVLWKLLHIQMIFWWISGGESGLPILFLRRLGIAFLNTTL